MKKIFYMALAAIAALSSCTKDNNTNDINDLMSGTTALCFTAKEAGSTVGIQKFYDEKNDIVFQYSTDNGETWIDYTPTNPETKVTLNNENDMIYFRRKDNSGTALDGFRFTGSGNLAVSGDIMSLLSNDGSVVTLPNNAFCLLFYNNDAISDASGLSMPATELSRNCCYLMFYDCHNLTSAPALPATTLAYFCYQGMFSDCWSLESAPALPATTLADFCYQGMFSGCGRLTSAPELPATTLAANCYQQMFNGCVRLASAPQLPATTLADRCYQRMFRECRSLESAPELPATTLADYCYQEMFNNCERLASAPELPATTLAAYCYQEMFRECHSLESAPELPATTLADGCYKQMFVGCVELNRLELYVTEYDSNMFDDWLGKGEHEDYAGSAWVERKAYPIIRIKWELFDKLKEAGLTIDDDSIVTSGSFSTIPNRWKVEVIY